MSFFVDSKPNLSNYFLVVNKTVNKKNLKSIEKHSKTLKGIKALKLRFYKAL